jgi:hypothetical protein
MHIGTDPRTEALELHIRQQRLVERAQKWRKKEPFVIWDIGLGPAGNAIMAINALHDAEASLDSKTIIEIHSFEISTEVLEFALRHAGALEYLLGWEEVIRQLLQEGVVSPVPKIQWCLHRGDFSRNPPCAPAPSAIFFDPYSPARNIEMWNLETFRSLWAAVSAPDAPPCLMSNYTRSTAVRVTMALSGWFVGRGVPTGNKIETTIASNRVELLASPLGRHWLERVRSSTNASPIRGRNHERGPIAPEDFIALKSLPQFRGVGMLPS